MSTILEAVDIVRDFSSVGGTVHVLKGVSAKFEESALTVLKGRSGSGKTTLMNILGTLDKPTAGQVLISGRDITAYTDEQNDALRRNYLSFVFQSVALLGTMTAYQNVEFMLRIAQKPLDKKAHDRILHCLDLVGLSNRVNHYPYQLSGGEQQRVAIARAIVHAPKIIFADEPTAQLDSTTSYQVMNMFRTLIKEEKTTVVMTTHDQSMMELADRVYTMDDGRISSEDGGENA